MLYVIENNEAVMVMVYAMDNNKLSLESEVCHRTWMENFVPCILEWVYICRYIYLCVCAVRSLPGGVRKILRTRLKKGNGYLGKQGMEVARLLMMKKTTGDLKSKGKTLDTHATYMVNSCQGKVAGIIL